MYGDTDHIRALARSLRAQGHRVEHEAASLVALAEATPWHGLAADAMRGTTHNDAHSLRRTADLHQEAAAALTRHAEEVDRVKALIFRVEHEVWHLVDAARQRLSGLAGGLSGLAGVAGAVGISVPDPVDLLLDRFDPPPPGHRAWLSVDLPVAVPALDEARALIGALS